LRTVSSGFWSLLDQAAALGLTVITAKPLFGPIRLAKSATVGLDLRATPGGGLELGPRIELGDDELVEPNTGVLGDPAHGLFWTRHGADGNEELHLARLDPMIAPELQRLIVESQRLAVPAADRARFVAEFVPRLQQNVSVVSGDRSVRLPDAVEPTLAVTAEVQPGHHVRLHWTVRYARESGVEAYPVDELPALRSLRDSVAEEQLLDALELPYASLPTELDGPHAARFVEQVVPQLRRQNVQVDLLGDVPDYRLATDPPQIQLAVDRRSGSADWFDLKVKVAMEGEEVPFDELFVALTRGEDYLITENGVYFSLDRPQFVALRDLIEESKALHDHSRPELTVNRFETSLWDDLVSLGTEIDQSAQWRRNARALAGVDAMEPVAVPESLHAVLRPYQLEGYRWLSFLWTHGLGGILADDMGLGKTVQTLALIAHAREIEPDGLCPPAGQPPDPPGPFLVVAPTSVVSNWAAEAARFTPGLRVVGLTESTAKRRRPIAEAVADADLVITSYALLRIELDALAELEWSGMILDEAQFVKNHRGKTYQAAKRMDAAFKLAITGTPLENSLMDLWALLSITAPGLFPHADRFGEYYRTPIERRGDTARLEQLRRRIRPLVLRRTKSAVAAELPAKQEQVVEIELHPRHQRLYQTHLQRERQRVLGLIDDLEQNRFTVLRSLTLLRRLSLDPALLDEANASVPAAKVEVLLADLAEIVGEGHQALVFSQFTTFLTRIRARLDDAGIAYAYLDGRTRNRDRVVQRFREAAASVFLISLKAGGFGLNLSEAGYCFVLDPWWNPASEAQAVDRTHRIGQTKTVMVYRLVAKGTIEEKVMALKARKSELFGSIFDRDDLAATSLTAEEIRDLIGA
jgi:superfamily II DNA or RNA helicase